MPDAGLSARIGVHGAPGQQTRPQPRHRPTPQRQRVGGGRTTPVGLLRLAGTRRRGNRACRPCNRRPGSSFATPRAVFNQPESVLLLARQGGLPVGIVGLRPTDTDGQMELVRFYTPAVGPGGRCRAGPDRAGVAGGPWARRRRGRARHGAVVHGRGGAPLRATRLRTHHRTTPPAGRRWRPIPLEPVGSGPTAAGRTMTTGLRHRPHRPPTRRRDDRSPSLWTRAVGSAAVTIGPADLMRLTFGKAVANTSLRWLPFFLPTLAVAFHASTATLAALLGLAEAAGLSTLAAGRWLDRGRERLVIVAALVTAALASTVALLGTVAAFAVSAVLLGAAAGYVTVGGHAWISARVPFDRRARFIGLYEISWASALLIGAPVVAPVDLAVSAGGALSSPSPWPALPLRWRWPPSTTASRCGPTRRPCAPAPDTGAEAELRGGTRAPHRRGVDRHHGFGHGGDGRPRHHRRRRHLARRGPGRLDRRGGSGGHGPSAGPSSWPHRRRRRSPTRSASDDRCCWRWSVSWSDCPSSPSPGRRCWSARSACWSSSSASSTPS